MPTCAAYGCNNRQDKKIPGISFHKFPQDPFLRKIWILASRRQNFEPTNNSHLCSAHFSDDQLYRISSYCTRLKLKARPNVNLPQIMKDLNKKRKINNLDITNKESKLKMILEKGSQFTSVNGLCGASSNQVQSNVDISLEENPQSNNVSISDNSLNEDALYIDANVSHEHNITSNLNSSKVKSTSLSHLKQLLKDNDLKICENLHNYSLSNPETETENEKMLKKKLEACEKQLKQCRKKVKVLQQKNRRYECRIKKLRLNLNQLIKAKSPLNKFSLEIFEDEADSETESNHTFNPHFIRIKTFRNLS